MIIFNKELLVYNVLVILRRKHHFKRNVGSQVKNCPKVSLIYLSESVRKGLILIGCDKLMSSNFNASYSNLLLTYNKDSLFSVHISKCMEMVYKIINNLYPKYLEKLSLMKNVDFNL